MPLTADEFSQHLVRSGLMTADELERFQKGLPEGKRSADGQALARELVAAKKLTKYQASAVYQGKIKGLVLGNYVVLEKIGQGGMGQVFKARHRRMDRLVALKVLPSKTMNSPDVIERFRREVKAAAKLDHPNIVTAHDADEADGIHYLVMQFVDGRDLGSLVKDQRQLTPAEATDYILQAARGLDFAHKHGVVHRDIKPANLLLDNGGQIKILDMGLARLESVGDASDTARGGLTQSGQIMGTVDYMSPEQAEDTRQAGPASDIYSLGCTLYVLLTGQPLYSGDTMMRKLLAHREGPIPSLRASRPDVSPQLDAVYQKMVAKTPEQRQASMAAVVAELEACLRAAPVSPTPVSSTPVSSRPIPALRSASASPPSLSDLKLSELTIGSVPAPAPGMTNAAPPLLPGVASPPPLRRSSNAAAARGNGLAATNPLVLAVVGGGVLGFLLLCGLLYVAFGTGPAKKTTKGGKETAENSSGTKKDSTALGNQTSGTTATIGNAGTASAWPLGAKSQAPTVEPYKPTGDALLDLQGEYNGIVFLNKKPVPGSALQVAIVPGNNVRTSVYRGGLPGDNPESSLFNTFDGTVRGTTATTPNWTVYGGEAYFRPNNKPGSGTLKRVERKSVTLGMTPPAGAVVLYNGADMGDFTGTRSDGLLNDGAVSRRKFQDFSLHLEFRVPFVPDKTGQGRGNSGVFLQDRYELQILDSFGLPHDRTTCGAFFNLRAPDMNMSFPPMSWQTYDIDFTAAKFTGNTKTSNARATVRHNGVIIHNDIEITAASGTGLPEGPTPGPIKLQDHGGRVHFRNVWVIERAAGSALSPGGAPDAQGFVPLFDGSSLAGWDGDARIWSVNAGAIVGQRTASTTLLENTCLVWKGGDLADFELKFKALILSGNSGVQFRSETRPNWGMSGYQLDIDATGEWTGTLYEEKGRGVLVRRGVKVAIDAAGNRRLDSAGASAQLVGYKKDDWNEYHIVARGPRLEIKVNGSTTCDITDEQQPQSRRTGKLGLHVHAGPPMTVMFKELRYKKL